MNNEKIDASGKEAAQNTITALNTTYFDKFNVEGNTRYSDLDYMYKVQHHYIEHDSRLEGTGEAQHVIVYTHEEIFYAPLHSQQEIHPIQKPTTAFGGLTVSYWDTLDDEGKESKANEYNISVAYLEKLVNHHYIFDVDHAELHRNGRVYAAGMQTFHLYYEASSTIDDDHANKTLAEILQHFLDIKNVEAHFGIKLQENGGNWKVEQLYTNENGEPVVDEDGNHVHDGIHFVSTTGNQDDTLYITEKFFDEIRAYGVETITFTFATKIGSNKQNNIAYNIYQQEDKDENVKKPLPVYYTDNQGKIQSIDAAHSLIEVPRVTIYLKDITPGGGLLFDPAPKMSSNTAEFGFLNVEFGLYHDAQNL